MGRVWTRRKCSDVKVCELPRRLRAPRGTLAGNSPAAKAVASTQLGVDWHTLFDGRLMTESVHASTNKAVHRFSLGLLPNKH